MESCLSLHPAVSEVAVVGLPDERWGQVVAAFIHRRAAVTPDELDAHCRASGLAKFKRPRRFVFVDELPKSPVGKLLRRKLTAGEYTKEPKEGCTMSETDGFGAPMASEIDAHSSAATSFSTGRRFNVDHHAAARPASPRLRGTGRR